MARDRWTGVTFAHVVKGKGFTDDWIVRQLATDVDSLGYPELRLKADTESSIKVILNRIKELKESRGNNKVHIDPAIPGQPQTNGVAEKAVQDVTTQVRKYKVALETRLGKPILARSVVFKWIVRHVADTINRHTVGHDGRVPFQRLMNRVPKPIDT